MSDGIVIRRKIVPFDRHALQEGVVYLVPGVTQHTSSLICDISASAVEKIFSFVPIRNHLFHYISSLRQRLSLHHRFPLKSCISSKLFLSSVYVRHKEPSAEL